MENLVAKIADFIQSEADAVDDAAFNTLALALFARQYAQNMPYQRLCDSAAQTPDTVNRWQDIPMVPAFAFKQFALSCVPSEEAVAVFHSSGTTGEQKSSHFFDSDGLVLYEVSLRQGFETALRADRPARILALMPPPEETPHSSLSHMLGALNAEKFYWQNDSELATALSYIKEPVLVFGTAFAWVQLFDSTNLNWHLPPRSMVLETGGFKGRTREVPREELYALFQARLGVTESHCWSEYGMSEMASQFYGQGLDATKRGPHWVRTRAINPVTGLDAENGEPGLLCHYDLANFNSVMALQTQDLGVMTPPHGFILLGRAAQAPIRGCSLTVEELWNRQQ